MNGASPTHLQNELNRQLLERARRFSLALPFRRSFGGTCLDALSRRLFLVRFGLVVMTVRIDILYSMRLSRSFRSLCVRHGRKSQGTLISICEKNVM